MKHLRPLKSRSTTIKAHFLSKSDRQQYWPQLLWPQHKKCIEENDGDVSSCNRHLNNDDGCVNSSSGTDDDVNDDSDDDHENDRRNDCNIAC